MVNEFSGQKSNCVKFITVCLAYVYPVCDPIIICFPSPLTRAEVPSKHRVQLEAQRLSEAGNKRLNVLFSTVASYI